MIIASLYPFPFFIGHGHDVNFSLIRDNEIFSCEEGKINAVVMNQYDRFPERAMMAGFKHFGISAEDVDIWVFGKPHHTPVKEALSFFFSEFKAKSYEELCRSDAIRFVGHHLSHAALAVYGSGFDEGMFLTMDDSGDEAEPYDSTWGTFKGNSIQLLGKSEDHLLGLANFHNFICEAVGYLGNVDNGKVMGLAAYGEVSNELYRELRRFLVISSDGFSAQSLLKRDSKSPYRLHKFKMDAYHRYKVVNSPNPPKVLFDLTKFYSAPVVAATGQKVFEDVALEIIDNLIRSTGARRLACSGGTFQNIVLNTRLLDLDLDEIYIPSAPNDAGLSLGAALHVSMGMRDTRPRDSLTPYLGPAFRQDEIESLLREYNLVYRKSSDVCTETAQLLADGKVVGWFQGRSELGPRALGARSVLADPRKLNNKAKINQLLKRRDWFMPYAPSVTVEDAGKVFFSDTASPYMAFSFSVREDYLDRIPAAVHVDGTSRPNTVQKEWNGSYHTLIGEFEKITGIPVILNTSFNRHGIATIVTPRQAVEHLLNGCVDLLVMEDFMILPEKKTDAQSPKLYDERYFLLIEEIEMIIDAVLRSSPADVKDVYGIIEFNREKLTRRSIDFDVENGKIIIAGRSIPLHRCGKEELRQLLFPIFEANESHIWKEI